MAQCELITGDCREELTKLPNGVAHCCVTSPPYFGLRDYGCAGQVGVESSLEEYVGTLVAVFQEVRRVLRDDGTLWLNLGDCFVSRGSKANANQGLAGLRGPGDKPSRVYADESRRSLRKFPAGLKPKDLIGLPWRVAFALQADGWWLRSDIVWHKPNPVPESVKDRPTRSHEFIFLFAKSRKYFFDHTGFTEPCANGGGSKNRRSVWTIPTQPLPDAHFAAFPPRLIEPCILAGCPSGGLVLDVFSGAGTTGMVAINNGRRYLGIELNPKYNEIAQGRLARLTDT